MARTSATNENHRPRGRRLLIYGLGFVLLTNVLTVLFVILLRGPRQASIAVAPAASAPAPAATGAAEPRPASRSVHVTSRPSGAVVRYQGNVQGTTPVTVSLPAGAAGVLSLEKDGYRARSVTVKPDDTRVRVRLYHAPSAGAEAPNQASRNSTTPSAPAPEPRTAPQAAPAAAAPPAPATDTAPPSKNPGSGAE